MDGAVSAVELEEDTQQHHNLPFVRAEDSLQS